MARPTGMTKHTAKRQAWFDDVVKRFRLILTDHRQAGVGFEIAFARAMGSLDREERRRWYDLFLEYKDEWQLAFNREGITEEPEAEMELLLQIA